MTEFAVAAALVVAGGLLGMFVTRRRYRRHLDHLRGLIQRGDSADGSGTVAADGVLRAVVDREADLGRRLEEAQSAESMLLGVLTGVQDPLLLVGGNGEVRFINPAAERLLAGHFDNDGRLLHHRLLELARRTGTETKSELLKLFGGRDYLATCSQLELGTMLVLRDITDQRRAGEIRRDFVADASHELKTPVATIQAGSETVVAALEDGDLDAAGQFARQVAQASVRLSRIVSDLLDLSRLESEIGDIEDVELGVLLHEIARNAVGKPVPTVHVPAQKVIVPGSTADFDLAFSNLISNAVRHTPDDGSIVVRLVDGPAGVAISVSDTGEGIPSKHLPRIFERFYRADSARSRERGGTGLGLAIAKHVVNQHGGTIHVESELGQGTTFTVKFPPRHQYSSK